MFKSKTFFNIKKFIRNQFLFQKKKELRLILIGWILTRVDFDRVDFDSGWFWSGGFWHGWILNRVDFDRVDFDRGWILNVSRNFSFVVITKNNFEITEARKRFFFHKVQLASNFHYKNWPVIYKRLLTPDLSYEVFFTV